MNRFMAFFQSVYRNYTAKPVYPRYLTYLVTYHCNSRCVMCDCWKRKPQNELNAREAQNIFSSFPHMDFVRLTGGEPFLRNDLPEIVHSIDKHLKPLFLHITTNGLLEERIVRFCREYAPDSPLCLLVSVDGMKKRHDKIRGIPGAWDQVMSTLSALAPLRKKRKLKLAVNQTIVDAEGIQEHRLLNTYLKRLEIPVHAVMAYDASATYHTADEVNVGPAHSGLFTTFGVFSCRQITDLLREIDGDLKKERFIQRIAKNYYWRGVRNRLLGGQGDPNPSCVALNSHLRILPNGRISTCQFNSKVVGDLRDESLEKIWSGQKIQMQRKWVQNCPGCWAECEVLPNAVYSGDLLKKWYLASQKLLA